MRRLFRSFSERWSTHQSISWHGRVRPAAMSVEYEVLIEYRLGDAPCVWVPSPRLERCNGQEIAHLYEEGNLCLYWPAAKDWTPNKLIAETIVPWISAWLYHYEVWHATDGEWLGGGVHLTAGAKRRRKHRKRPIWSAVRSPGDQKAEHP
jgi:hypothetical protein